MNFTCTPPNAASGPEASVDFKSSPLEGEFAYLATIGQNAKAEGWQQLGDLE
jgi:hypothetical protein